MPRKPAETIHIKVRTLDEVKDFVEKEIPRYYRGTFVRAVAENLVEWLKISYPPEKHDWTTSRAWAYGLRKSGITGKTADSKGYFSLKQRRFVMAMLREKGWDGKSAPPTYQRTNKTAGGWQVEGEGVKTAIVNKTEGARWTMSDYWQARQPALVGWPKVGSVITDNIDDAMLVGIDAVHERMKGRKK